jgi:hypothetical protein
MDIELDHILWGLKAQRTIGFAHPIAFIMSAGVTISIPKRSAAWKCLAAKSAAPTDRTHDRTRPTCNAQFPLANRAPSTHDRAFWFNLSSGQVYALNSSADI